MIRRAVLSICLLLVACGPSSDSEAGREAAFQRAMAVATKQARAQLPYFWEHLEAPATTEFDFLLKVAFPIPDPGAGQARTEALWVDQVAREGDILSGQLASTPEALGDLKEGDVMTFTEDMIADWAFFSGEQLFGHYTTRVMLPRLPSEQAEIMRSMFGENPE